MLVVGVGGVALAARDGEPAGVVAGPPDQDQPVTTVTGAPVPSGTPLQGVWPEATEEAVLARPDAATTLADPLTATAEYLSERLPTGTEWGLDAFQRGEALSGSVHYDTVDGLEGVVLLRSLGGEGGPWYVLAAVTDVLDLELTGAGDESSSYQVRVTSRRAGELRFEGGATSDLGDGPVVPGGARTFTVGDGDGGAPLSVQARLLDEDGSLLAFLEEPAGSAPERALGGPVETPEEEVAASDTTVPRATTIPPTTVPLEIVEDDMPVEENAALGETTVLLYGDGLGFLGAGGAGPLGCGPSKRVHLGPRLVWTRSMGTGDGQVDAVWPLLGLRLETERLVLRLASGEEAMALVALAPADLETDPSWPAPRAASRRIATEVLQWWWRALGTWTVDHWRLPLGVWLDGEPVGFQELEAERFGLLRTVETSSWLVPGRRGLGLGTEMRAAVLALAFEHLGAEVATSGAWEDNAGSLGVSRSLGYEANGEVRHVHHDRVGVMRRVRLPRSSWDPTARTVTVNGFEACRGWFGEVDD